MFTESVQAFYKSQLKLSHNVVIRRDYLKRWVEKITLRLLEKKLLEKMTGSSGSWACAKKSICSLIAHCSCVKEKAVFCERVDL